MMYRIKRLFGYMYDMGLYGFQTMYWEDLDDSFEFEISPTDGLGEPYCEGKISLDGTWEVSGFVPITDSTILSSQCYVAFPDGDKDEEKLIESAQHLMDASIEP
jgi:hypothetical protein